MSSGGNRLVSVASGRTLDTGAVNSPDVVPVGATAIACNVTVDRTQNQGFLAVTIDKAAEVRSGDLRKLPVDAIDLESLVKALVFSKP